MPWTAFDIRERERVKLSGDDHSHIMNALEWLMISKMRHGCDHSSSVMVKAEASLCMFGSGTPFLLRIRHHGIP